MVITWYGLSSFNISAGKFTLVTDPFDKTVGLTPIRVQTDVAIISNSQNPAYNNKDSLGGENTFIIDGPGEYDARNIFVRGIAAKGDEPDKQTGIDYTTIYGVLMEDIRLGFLGSIKQSELTDEQLEELGDIDILFVPVGGKSVCDAEEAVTIINQIEPRIIIPMHYQQKTVKLAFDPVDKFLKEIGAKPNPEDKLTIKKSELNPEEQTRVVVLKAQRD